MLPTSTQSAAERLAAALDRTLTAGPDEATHDALHEIGELTGGLSCLGFVADLRTHMAVIEDEMMDAPVRPSTWHIQQAQDHAAREWIAGVERIMARVAPAEMRRAA